MNAQQAILTARKTWYCIKPQLRQFDEKTWLKEGDASFRNGAWHISWGDVPPGYAGGGLNMTLAKDDGRLLDIYMTQ